MSTGTSTFEEIKESVSLFKKLNKASELYLMHCVSSYPCEPKIANINRMIQMMTLCDNVG